MSQFIHCYLAKQCMVEVKIISYLWQYFHVWCSFTLVFQFMFLAWWSSCKAHITILALMRFNSCMCEFMTLAIWWSSKAIITKLALIRFYICVWKFIPLAFFWAVEVLIAMLALMRFHFCMDHFMPLAMRWQPKTLITILALIRFYLCVCTFMVFTNWGRVKALFDNIDTDRVLLQCEWVHVSCSCLTEWSTCHKTCTCMVLLLCV